MAQTMIMTGGKKDVCNDGAEVPEPALLPPIADHLPDGFGTLPTPKLPSAQSDWRIFRQRAPAETSFEMKSPAGTFST